MVNIVMFPTNVLVASYAQLRLRDSTPSLKLVLNAQGTCYIAVFDNTESRYVAGTHVNGAIKHATDIPLKWLYIAIEQKCDFMVLREHNGRISLDVVSDIAFLQSASPRDSLANTPSIAEASRQNASNPQGIVLH